MERKKFTSKRSLLVALASLVMMLMAQSAAAYHFTALSGTGGDGNEGFAKLVDGEIQTKWGQSYVSGVSETYIIFKSDRAIVPKDYCLVIANDTYRFPDRNWQSWNIYAANFASDEDAVRGASEWVLVDKKENEVLPTGMFEAVDLTCSENVTEAYTYFMIEITAAISPTDIWVQMSEFSWGTSNEFFNNGPIGYMVLDGDRNNSDTEGLPRLFDGLYTTKFGNSFTEGQPQFAVFRTTRPVAPSYYCLVTGNDNERWTHRNWKTWSIYGMNTTNEAEVTRDSEKWVLIDERVDVSEEVLPDLNYYEVYFIPNQGVTEAFSYFKIEIYAMQAGSGFMQMSEFFLGDAGSLEADAQKHYESVLIDLSKPMQKSLAEAYEAKLQSILTAPDIFAVNSRTQECQEMQEQVKASINAYDTYINIVGQLRNHYENHDCITGEGRTLVGTYLDTEAGPSDQFPNGTFAYIIANGLLDEEGIGNEGIFVNMMMEKYASDLTEGAIDVEYEPFDGVAGFGNENFINLLDGQDDTKWCSGNGDYWITFRTSEPIMPTYYRLVTGNDTGGNPDRNWKTWRIYAANFESEYDCVRESAEWVLIDEKVNIGTDQLPAANYATTYLYLSNPPAVPYEYFKIEIAEPTGLMQMGEFEFQNGANFVLARQDYYDEFAQRDPSEAVACTKYKEDFQKALAKLQTTASIIELSELYNTLTSLLNDIATSEELYDAFELAVDELAYAITYMGGDDKDYWDAFLHDDIDPCNDYPYGSYSYIMDNLQLDNSELNTYNTYLGDIARAALEGGFCVVSGNMETWGEKENYYKLVDKDHQTKWGGEVQPGGSYVIFYSMEPTQPLFYKLTTGNDTQAYSGRNWRNWQIYGGNFEKNTDATLDADGWVLLDNREGIGQDRLPAANFTTVPFGFSEGVDEEYKYYKIVVTGAYSGTTIQMSEFEFGSEDEIDDLRSVYMTEVETLSIEGIIATDSLINAYYDAEDDLYSADDLETIYQGYLTMVNTYKKIQESAVYYERYQEKVEAMKGTIATFEESDELTALKSYLFDEVSAGDPFPNGSAATVVGKHLLNNDELMAEIIYMNGLAKAALLKGYAPGADITAMVANPSFGQGSEGWNGEVYASSYNAEHTMSAAEFCREQANFNIWQTLTGLKNGYYLVGMNGGTRPGNDFYSQNYSTMLYANDNVTYIKADIDGMIAKDEAIDRVNSWLNGDIADWPITTGEGEYLDTLGYALHGVQSCCYAFLAGRYPNYVVARVTDGTLTFGAKNEGTAVGNEWTGLGNTTIKFLGDLDSDAAAAGLDLALECQNQIVNGLDEYEGFIELADYKSKPYVNEAALKTLLDNMKSAPASGAAKYDVLVSNSDCFKAIYAAKNAYVKSIEAMQAVQNKWDAHVYLMDDVAHQMYDDVIWNIYDGSMGLYTAAEALAEAADIKEVYPCYVDLDPAKAKGAIDIEETAPFEYVIAADGNRPNIGLNKCMYDPLTPKQNILSFEYKSDTELEGGTYYFAHPALSTSEVVTYGNLPAANEWTKIYVSIENDYGWGSATDHWMRWDLATSGTFNMSVRRPLIITEAQMNAEGGQLINSIAPSPLAPVETNEAIYNIMGQRVTPDAKGILIRGGKKILVK